MPGAHPEGTRAVGTSAVGSVPMGLRLTCPVGSDYSRVPAGCSPARRRPSRFDGHTAAHEQPRNDRIRVPHLAGLQFISTPYEWWNVSHKAEEQLCLIEVSAKKLRTGHRMTRVRNHPFVPTANLVSERPKASESVAEDRALDRYTPRRRVSIWDGPRCLNRVSALRCHHLQRRVVESNSRSVLTPSHERFVDEAVRANKSNATSTERNPIQMHAELRWCPQRTFGGTHRAIVPMARDRGACDGTCILGEIVIRLADRQIQ